MLMKCAIILKIAQQRLFVNGITRSLEAAQYHARNNNQHGMEVEIQNALVELGGLREELDKPDIIFTMGSR